jgi:predicted phosphodiesterase
MLIALISDIHANQEALRRVVEDARRVDPHIRFWCLGDVLGRGPHPDEVWAYTINDVRPEHWVVGNWDWGLSGRIQNIASEGTEIGDFGPVWWENLLHQIELLRHTTDFPALVDCLNRLPVVIQAEPGVYLTHGELKLTPNLRACVTSYSHDHLLSQRVTNWRRSVENLSVLQGDALSVSQFKDWELPALILVGHTHQRGIIHLGDRPSSEFPIRNDVWYRLDMDKAHPDIVNPGSVGFPRDHSRGASYAVLDLGPSSSWVCFREVWFDRQLVVNDLDRYGYPPAAKQEIQQMASPDLLSQFIPLPVNLGREKTE